MVRPINDELADLCAPFMDVDQVVVSVLVPYRPIGRTSPSGGMIECSAVVSGKFIVDKVQVRHLTTMHPGLANQSVKWISQTVPDATQIHFIGVKPA